jgi:AraC-like DNA-binding protein
MHKPNQSRKGKGTAFPHITDAASEFGCSRTTLYRVLKKQLPDHHDYQRRYLIYTRGLRKIAA